MFEALVQEIFQLSNRPDLRAETESAIRQAVLGYHHLDFFWRDKTVGVINVTSGARVRHEIPLSTFGNLRGIAAISPYDGAHDSVGKPLAKQVTLGQHRCEYWQLMGDKLVIVTNQRTHQFAVDHWVNPVLAPADKFHSWVVDLYREAVIDATLAKIFTITGHVQLADRHAARVGNKLAPGTHVATILGEQLEQTIRSY